MVLHVIKLAMSIMYKKREGGGKGGVVLGMKSVSK